METGDSAYIKKMNRRLILDNLIRHKSLSRSEVARLTGLNKATISSQVQTLLHDRLLVESQTYLKGMPGRRPIKLEINRLSGYSIGLDIDENNYIVVFCDLRGTIFHKEERPLPSDDFYSNCQTIIHFLQPFIDQYNSEYNHHSLIGIGIGVHGIVNKETDKIYTPKQQWLVSKVSRLFEDAFETTVHLENNANLCVLAEQGETAYHSNLLTVTLSSGIGLGIIQDNKIFRGFHGFAGEVGHMIVHPNGRDCPCGNKGCWELYASETALRSLLKKALPEINEDKRIESMFTEENHYILKDYLDMLSIGLNNIITIFNPETIILNGAIINAHADMIERIESRLDSKFAKYKEIRSSRIGKEACALGGSAIVQKHFLGLASIFHR
ncbi:ROK family transcriptional regulator [Bacillus sp. H-16]|uniref:ROK family protein n=1 Tax=Alteribacter salitolerans TaxID=2912333 RepID=UPI001963FF4D|nr:ROK family protein [Alteribacter salitolerans]MBM7097777.1 ROK family transcriptional regulator [Alteribacter salitolerans]